MAIQIPNAGTGNGASGDNEFVLWTKVINNFSDQSNAASKLVGTENGRVPLSEQVFSLANKPINTVDARGTTYDANTILDVDKSYLVRGNTTNFGVDGFLNTYTMTNSNYFGVAILQELYPYNQTTRRFYRLMTADGFSNWIEYYTTGNTTKEPTTGYLKAASPILHLFNDDLVKEHEAVEQDIIVEKLGTGDYLIKGSTGLSEEGWNLSPPKDIHGNVLCFVEATEADGNINVKTYKRKFDFDIVAIVADYDQPLDIPEGHSVDLRLNDLPYENLDDTQAEV